MLSDAKCFQLIKNRKEVNEMQLLMPLLERMYKEGIINASTYIEAKKEAEKYNANAIFKQA